MEELAITLSDSLDSERKQFDSCDFIDFGFVDLTNLLDIWNHSQIILAAIVHNTDDALNWAFIFVLAVHSVEQAIILLQSNAGGCLFND